MERFDLQEIVTGLELGCGEGYGGATANPMTATSRMRLGMTCRRAALPRAYPDPRELSAQLAAREGSGATTCHADAGAGASLPLEAPSPTRIKCEWLRQALLPLGTGQLLSVHTVDRQLPRRLVSYQGKH